MGGRRKREEGRERERESESESADLSPKEGRKRERESQCKISLLSMAEASGGNISHGGGEKTLEQVFRSGVQDYLQVFSVRIEGLAVHRGLQPSFSRNVSQRPLITFQ